MKNFILSLSRLLRNTSGATAIEYSLIAGVICIGIVTGVTSIGKATNDSFTAVSEQGFGQ